MPLRVPVHEIVPDVASDILTTVSSDSDREDEYADYDKISGSNSASKEHVLLTTRKIRSEYLQI